jgi:hypothetical protein
MKTPLDRDIIVEKSNENSEGLLKENYALKEKIIELEQQCRDFEKKVAIAFFRFQYLSKQNKKNCHL